MSEHQRTILVLAGGEPVDRPIPSVDLVIAADSGVRHAVAAGLHVDLVVGDLDSVDEAELAAVVADGARVERHPVDKDATDLELALEAAVRAGADRTFVVGLGGGRLDHFLANLLVLAAPALAGTAIEAWVGTARMTVVRDAVVLEGEPGDLLTLVPLGGRATGVRTEGLRYPLDDETLEAGTTRGVSNVLESATVKVSVADGVLLAVQP